ncbi:MAG: M28 family metallopeptidase [Pseudoxanthomonas sp.]
MPLPRLLLPLLFVFPLAVTAADAPPAAISADALAAHVRTLASDAFEGRAPASAGEDRTVAYLVDQFRKAGLQPGGEHGGWTQAVPLVRAEVDGPVAASIDVAGHHRVLANGQDVVLQTLQPLARVHLQKVPMVFVGYGIDAPERHWDDYKGADLHGKLAVVLVNDPDFETPQPGAFDGRALTYYGRWTYKFEELARRGAAGVLIVHEDAPAAYGWATVQASGTAPVFDIQRADAMAAHTPVRGWMQRAVAVQLFADAGLDFEAAKHAAQRADFRPLALGDATFSADFKVKREQVVSRNVIARLPGRTHADEAVIFSAHWDAFGIGAPDAGGDRVRHGAVDDGTGVASVLELARVFAAGPRPQRSVYFIAWTAEEKGLLGSSYYAAHPLVPLVRTAAVINMEMFSPDGPTRDIASWGHGKVSLEGELAQVAQDAGRTLSPDPSPEAGFFYRADHFPFARAGVPAITVGPGLDMLDGGTAHGSALRKAYFACCYHQPGDRWRDDWDATGQAADTELVRALGQRIADSRDWPQWLPGSEFRAARQASAQQRGD